VLFSLLTLAAAGAMDEGAAWRFRRRGLRRTDGLNERSFIFINCAHRPVNILYSGPVEMKLFAWEKG
jgi:hypothetical protein